MESCCSSPERPDEAVVAPAAATGRPPQPSVGPPGAPGGFAGPVGDGGAGLTGGFAGGFAPFGPVGGGGAGLTGGRSGGTGGPVGPFAGGFWSDLRFLLGEVRSLVLLSASSRGSVNVRVTIWASRSQLATPRRPRPERSLSLSRARAGRRVVS